MATTRIIPLHAGKGRTVGKAISDIIGYLIMWWRIGMAARCPTHSLSGCGNTL